MSNQTTFRSKANRDNAYLTRSRGAEDQDFHRHRRYQRAGSRDPGKHGTQSADRSQELRFRPTRELFRCARLLREAVNTVRARAPAGVAPSYYDLCCALQVLPRDADWRAILAPDITREKILPRQSDPGRAGIQIKLATYNAGRA